VLTYSGEGPGENGKLTKMKTSSEMKDKDMVVFKMYGDGKDAEMVCKVPLDNHKLGGSETELLKTTGRMR
jgi:hypothetical protein